MGGHNEKTNMIIIFQLNLTSQRLAIERTCSPKQGSKEAWKQEAQFIGMEISDAHDGAWREVESLEQPFWWLV
jgi:hypothetical protein